MIEKKLNKGKTDIKIWKKIILQFKKKYKNHEYKQYENKKKFKS